MKAQAGMFRAISLAQPSNFSHAVMQIPSTHGSIALLDILSPFDGLSVTSVYLLHIDCNGKEVIRQNFAYHAYLMIRVSDR
ncbi:MAG: hypothetical protein GF398_03300 [Chitinivibrionales bacterium]|nr:hypothetical protein [Chitinivibrionales bacterium]